MSKSCNIAESSPRTLRGYGEDEKTLHECSTCDVKFFSRAAPVACPVGNATALLRQIAEGDEGLTLHGPTSIDIFGQIDKLLAE